VTTVPLEKISLQSPPHVIPAGLDVTVPEPAPTRAMFRMKFVEKVAVQVRVALIVTLPSLQSASPVQPTNVHPLAGVAVSATAVPLV
jgi:hypothetical protein